MSEFFCLVAQTLFLFVVGCEEGRGVGTVRVINQKNVLMLMESWCFSVDACVLGFAPYGQKCLNRFLIIP